jgi:uncharacterized membrane protein
MDNQQRELEELRRLHHELLLRVSQLENKVELLRAQVPSGDEPSVKSADQASSSTPIVVEHSTSSPDLESRIGAHWLNRIGIVTVLVGVSLFLKYAFEGKWVGPAGRVSIGLLVGIAIIAWSEWFRVRGYRIFSFSLKALGLGTMYLSLWAAFQVYSLISWTLTFAAMVMVTGSTTALALAQKAEILALFALIGGFATPVLLYTGQSRAVQLFSYITLLNSATLVLAWRRAWRRLILASLLATMVLYFGWYAVFYGRTELGPTLGFATAFFVIFAIAPLVETVKTPDVPGGSWILLVAASLNSTAYFVELYLLLWPIDRMATVWCALCLAVVNAILGGFLRTERGDMAGQLRGLHFVLSTVFITLAIAIRFEPAWISMGWSLEAASLVALGFRQKSALVRWQALVLIAVTITKVFVYDLWRLELEHRIISFLALGMLLLVVSFLYQRDRFKLSLRRAAGGLKSADQVSVSATRKAETG